jgi:hypothetical protein
MKANCVLEEKMKRIIVGIMMIVAAGICFGQQRLVVPPFQDRNSGVDASQIETLTDLFINAVQRTNRFEVPDRDALALLSKEHNFQMSDWSDESKTVQMGRVLNANYIVRCIVSKIDVDVYLLLARLLDVNTAQILDSDELEFTSVRDARSNLDAFARDCLNNIRTASETQQQQKQMEEQRARENPFAGSKWRALVGGKATDCYMTFFQNGTLNITGLKTRIHFSDSAGYDVADIDNASATGTYKSTATSINFSLSITGKYAYSAGRYRKIFGTSFGTRVIAENKVYDFSESLLIDSTYSINLDRLKLGKFLIESWDGDGWFWGGDQVLYGVADLPLSEEERRTEYLDWIKVE